MRHPPAPSPAGQLRAQLFPPRHDFLVVALLRGRIPPLPEHAPEVEQRLHRARLQPGGAERGREVGVVAGHHRRRRQARHEPVQLDLDRARAHPSRAASRRGLPPAPPEQSGGPPDGRRAERDQQPAIGSRKVDEIGRDQGAPSLEQRRRQCALRQRHRFGHRQRQGRHPRDAIAPRAEVVVGVLHRRQRERADGVRHEGVPEALRAADDALAGFRPLLHQFRIGPGAVGPADLGRRPERHVALPRRPRRPRSPARARGRSPASGSARA